MLAPTPKDKAANFKLDVDADGIALITWDMPGSSMNVIDLAVIEELAELVEKVAADAAIKGAVITSGKDTFCAGADLTLLESLTARSASWRRTRARRPRPPMLFEREPQAVAALPAHRDLRQAVRRRDQRHRARRRLRAVRSPATIASPPTIDKTRLGLPEVKIGLFPGAGGTQRIARMMAPADALQFLLKGDQLQLDRAKAMKLVDAVVPAADLVKTAKDWVKANPQGQGAVGRRRLPHCRAGRSIPRPG